MCKCLLKLNSNVCAVVLKYSRKELLSVYPPITENHLESSFFEAVELQLQQLGLV